MTEKKQSKNKKDTTKKDNSKKKIDNLEKQIENLQKEVKEKNEKLLRTIADLKNYQKRMEKEIKSQKQDIKKRYLCEIIDLYELLLKAYEDKKPKEGLKLLINNLEKFFEKENIKCIHCKGKKFDHNYHEAITTIEKDNCENNIIVEEIKKGYLIDDKLLRPSQVVVSKNEKNK